MVPETKSQHFLVLLLNEYHTEWSTLAAVGMTPQSHPFSARVKAYQTSPKGSEMWLTQNGVLEDFDGLSKASSHDN